MASADLSQGEATIGMFPVIPPPKPTAPSKGPKGLPPPPPVPGQNTQGQQTSTQYDKNGNPLPPRTETQIMDNGMPVPQGQQLSPMLATQMTDGIRRRLPSGYVTPIQPGSQQPVLANFQTDRHDLNMPADQGGAIMPILPPDLMIPGQGLTPQQFAAAGDKPYVPPLMGMQ